MSDDDDNDSADDAQKHLEAIFGHKWNIHRDHWVLDERGEPALPTSFMGWVKWLSKSGAKIVKQEWIENVRVSTIFLGLDRSFGGPVPVLWETMTFSNRKEWDNECTRCSGGREQAEAMHAKMVELVKEKLKTNG